MAIFGGSFDPPHLGHLQSALALQRLFHFQRFLFLPCKDPVLKASTKANLADRLAMLSILCKPYPEFAIDLREATRNTPSYMVETLESFRKEYGSKVSINLLLGMDAFLQLPDWHRWQDLLKLSNIIVINRPGAFAEGIRRPLQEMIEKYETKQNQELQNNAAGKLLFTNAGYFDISSSKIRQSLHKGEEVDAMLPKEIYQYIKAKGLYQS